MVYKLFYIYCKHTVSIHDVGKNTVSNTHCKCAYSEQSYNTCIVCNATYSMQHIQCNTYYDSTMTVHTVTILPLSMHTPTMLILGSTYGTNNLILHGVILDPVNIYILQGT